MPFQFTSDDYDLLAKEGLADPWCEYQIVREAQRIRFCRPPGYTLFFLRRVGEDVEFTGLANYGARDGKFEAFIADLLCRVREECRGLDGSHEAVTPHV